MHPEEDNEVDTFVPSTFKETMLVLAKGTISTHLKQEAGHVTEPNAQYKSEDEVERSVATKTARRKGWKEPLIPLQRNLKEARDPFLMNMCFFQS